MSAYFTAKNATFVMHHQSHFRPLKVYIGKVYRQNLWQFCATKMTPFIALATLVIVTQIG